MHKLRVTAATDRLVCGSLPEHRAMVDKAGQRVALQNARSGDMVEIAHPDLAGDGQHATHRKIPPSFQRSIPAQSAHGRTGAGASLEGVGV